MCAGEKRLNDALNDINTTLEEQQQSRLERLEAQLQNMYSRQGALDLIEALKVPMSIMMSFYSLILVNCTAAYGVHLLNSVG